MHKYCIIITAVILAALSGCGSGSDPKVTLNGEKVGVATRSFDVSFARLEPVSEVYALFGGMSMESTENPFYHAGISGIPVKDFSDISTVYPDFYMCASPGAARAKSSTVHLDLIAADSGIARTLRQAIKAYDGNNKEIDNHVCLKLEGVKLQMESVVIREAGQDVTSQIPVMNYHLITSASQLSAKEALEGK